MPTLKLRQTLPSVFLRKLRNTGVIDVTPSELYFNFLRYSAQAKEFFVKGKKLAFDSMHLSGAIMDYKV